MASLCLSADPRSSALTMSFMSVPGHAGLRRSLPEGIQHPGPRRPTLPCHIKTQRHCSVDSRSKSVQPRFGKNPENTRIDRSWLTQAAGPAGIRPRSSLPGLAVRLESAVLAGSDWLLATDWEQQQGAEMKGHNVLESGDICRVCVSV